MFPIQMSGQRDKLVAALGAMVSNADTIEMVAPFIEQLGRDHRRFSVVTEHYMAVGASLMATLKRFLGRSWDAELADTWAQAYGLIAKVMVAAAEQHEDVAPAYWQADVMRVERRSMDVAVVEVAPAGTVLLQAGAVGGRGDPAAAAAVALLQPGERTAALRPSALPHPADRRRHRVHRGGAQPAPGRHRTACRPGRAAAHAARERADAATS